MKQIKFFNNLLSVGMMSLALGTMGVQVAQAQQSTHLLSTKCASINDSSWRKDNTDVSIGKELYTSVMYVASGSGLSCRLTPSDSGIKFQTLKLGFGIADDAHSNNNVVVNVYVNGNQVASRNVFTGGGAKTVLVDVKNARSVAIEVTCPSTSSSCYGIVRFFEASLEPIRQSRGARN
jgi:NPCBM/NEW2 domain